MIRFACFSDTHGAARPKTPYPILHAGDICDCGGDVTAPSNPSVLTWKEGTGWAVRGNHDCGPGADEVFRGGLDATGFVTMICNHLWLVGMGWHGERYYELPLERDLAKVAEDVLRQCTRHMFDGDHSILLTHYPPAAPGAPLWAGGHFYKAVEDVAKAIRPLAVVAGHLHQLQDQFRPAYSLDVGDGVSIPVICPGPDGVLLSVDADDRFLKMEILPLDA